MIFRVETKILMFNYKTVKHFSVSITKTLSVRILKTSQIAKQQAFDNSKVLASGIIAE